MDFIFIFLAIYIIFSALIQAYFLVYSIHLYFKETKESTQELNIQDLPHYSEDIRNPFFTLTAVFLSALIARAFSNSSSYYTNDDFYSRTIYDGIASIIPLLLIIALLYYILCKFQLGFGFYKIYSFNGRYKAVKIGGTWTGTLFPLYWLLFNRLWGAGIILLLIYVVSFYSVDNLLPSTIFGMEAKNIASSLLWILHLSIGFYGNELVALKLENEGYEYQGFIKSHTEKKAVNDFLFTRSIKKHQEDNNFLDRYKIKDKLISTILTIILGILTYIISYHVFGSDLADSSPSEVLILMILSALGYQA